MLSSELILKFYKIFKNESQFSNQIMSNEKIRDFSN